MDDEFFADPFEGKGRLVSDPCRFDVRAWSYTDDQGVTHVCHVYRVDPVLEANRERFNDSYGQRWGDGRVVASIPNGIYYHGDFAAATEARDEAWLKRFLNDPDNQKLRTFRGRI
jgi:hypothetical protein